MNIKLVYLALLAIFIGACSAKKSHSNGKTPPVVSSEWPSEKYRYVICTDMTHDDDNSLIRLLHFANEIDIEAIIVTEQGPETNRIDNWPTKMWDRAQNIIDTYGKVEDNLRMHDPNFPTANYFRNITKKGKGSAQRLTGSMDDGKEHFWNYVGESRDSEGSDFLQQVFEKEDDRPIYVGFWGGSITFAQAMWRYQQNHSKAEVRALLDKLIFHCISLQDVTFDYFMDLDEIGFDFYGDYDGERLVPSMILLDVVNFWKYIGATDVSTIHEVSGPLGKLYDKGGEGDTPAFLNLISMNRGLSHIERPEYGGWGDMFRKHSLQNVWLSNPEDSNELMRWLDEANNSFYARCEWEKKDFARCNHPPVAILKNSKTRGFAYLTAKPGDTLVLDAGNSSDVDGDALNFKWFLYDEAGSYHDSIVISQSNTSKASVVMPEISLDQEIHIVLQVTDTGSPSLVDYKRIILTAAP